MTREDLITLFQEKLRACSQQSKYRGHCTSDDIAQAVQVLTLVLDHPKLSAELLFEQLTGEKAQ